MSPHHPLRISLTMPPANPAEGKYQSKGGLVGKGVPAHVLAVHGHALDDQRRATIWRYPFRNVVG